VQDLRLFVRTFGKQVSFSLEPNFGQNDSEIRSDILRNTMVESASASISPTPMGSITKVIITISNVTSLSLTKFHFKHDEGSLGNLQCFLHLSFSNKG